jgi:hypothetical protein
MSTIPKNRCEWNTNSRISKEQIKRFFDTDTVEDDDDIVKKHEWGPCTSTGHSSKPMTHDAIYVWKKLESRSGRVKIEVGESWVVFDVPDITNKNFEKVLSAIDGAADTFNCAETFYCLLIYDTFTCTEVSVAFFAKMLQKKTTFGFSKYKFIERALL